MKEVLTVSDKALYRGKEKCQCTSRMGPWSRLLWFIALSLFVCRLWKQPLKFTARCLKCLMRSFCSLSGKTSPNESFPVCCFCVVSIVDNSEIYYICWQLFCGCGRLKFSSRNRWRSIYIDIFIQNSKLKMLFVHVMIQILFCFCVNISTLIVFNQKYVMDLQDRQCLRFAS